MSNKNDKLRLKKNSLRVLNPNENAQVQGGIGGGTTNDQFQCIPDTVEYCDDFTVNYDGCTPPATAANCWSQQCTVGCPTGGCPTRVNCESDRYNICLPEPL